MQQKSEIGGQGFSNQQVIAALMKLSTLAWQASTLRFSPPGTVERLAALFLDQLVALCAAEQGALFLTQHFTLPFAPYAEEVVPTQPARALIASTHMSTREAQTALSSAVLVHDPLQLPVNLPATMIWQRPLDVAPLTNSDAAPVPRISEFSALLLFVWPDAEQDIWQEAQHQALQLLPFLADLVDTILLQIGAALHENAQQGEMLPAELLATVGHEFRGPLTTIQGYATTLLHHDQQLALEERRDFLSAINEASVHLGKLVDRFLELAQFEISPSTFFPVSVDLLALAQESITAAQKGKSHHLLLTPAPARRSSAQEDTRGEALHDELALLGDRRLLRIMLDILLENAVAYSAPESLVKISVDPTDAAAVCAASSIPSGSSKHLALILPAHFQEHEPLFAIRVQDHGIGIEPAHLALLFRRFYRVDTRLTRDVNGLGLGLALCKAIVAQHRGMLWVESAAGEGSTFYVILPRGISQEAT